MKYFLIINEGLGNGLIESQILKPVSQNLNKEEIIIINIDSIISNQKRGQNFGLKILNIKMGIPYRIFLFNFFWFLTPFLAVLYSIILSVIVKKNSCIVARSYFPSLVCLFLSRIKKVQYIFDARSLFIHENITKKNFNEGQLNFKMWKFFEKKIIKNARKSIAVSLKQAEYYQAQSPSSNIEIIPCYSNRIPAYDLDIKQQLRYEMGYEEKDLVICYYGSLDHGWNNIEMYLNFFKHCLNKDYKICIISQNFQELRKDKRFITNGIFILDTDRNKEHLKYLQSCDYGVVIMPKVEDWETRLSVKFVEYLTNGLGVIVGEYLGEAARYCNNYFKNSSIIYKSEKDLMDLKKVPQHELIYSRQKASELFNSSNIKKLFS